jgi:beta-lactamase superfamily II metal-dependent hydrolase
LDKLGSLSAFNFEDKFLAKKQEELTDPIAYFDIHIGRDKSVFRMLITHPDMDHMTGLYRLHHQEPKEIINFWHTGYEEFNLKDTTDDEWEDSPYEKRDWETYKQLRDSHGSPKSLLNTRGVQNDFWTADGVEIWSPSQALIGLATEKQEPNILSMVLKISYKGRSVVLGGDATGDESWADIADKIDLPKIDILKASHHGRKSGYYGPAVKKLSPWLTITSVTEKAYDATQNYRRYSDYTVSLRDTKDIKITINDDGTIYYPPKLKDYWKPKLANR